MLLPIERLPLRQLLREEHVCELRRAVRSSGVPRTFVPIQIAELERRWEGVGGGGGGDDTDLAGGPIRRKQIRKQQLRQLVV